MKFNFIPPLPEDWRLHLIPFLSQKKLEELDEKLYSATQVIYPPAHEIFRALELTPFESTKVLLLGQDPYHGPQQACGLCFAVKKGVPPPPSLKNIMKEIQADLHGDLDDTELTGWASQGVLLLNRTLSVFEGSPLSHKSWGWDEISFGCIKALISSRKPLVFVCLGKESETLVKKLGVESYPQIKLITAAHPSPLSAHRGFLGSKIFSRINAALSELRLKPIDFIDKTPVCKKIF